MTVRPDPSMTAASLIADATAPTLSDALSPLRLQRQPAADGGGPAPAPREDRGSLEMLGGLVYGPLAGDAPGPLSGLGMPRLLGGLRTADAWFARGPIEAGQTGSVRWCRNDDWLMGALDLDQPAGEALEPFSRRAYAQVFAVLREAGLPHLQRLWNYVPDINVEVDGLERYRQFNAGRQQAFIDDGRDVQSGSPAACALGTRVSPGEGAGRLRIRFLAGRQPALPIENPRQVPAYRYPADYGPRRPSFSRAALVDAGAGQIGLLISGTASIVDHRSVHPGDVRAQTRETLANLQAVIDAAQARSNARFSLATLDCTAYIRRAEDATAVQAVLTEAIGPERAAQAVYLQADICRSELLVEIEAQAFTPGRWPV